MKAGTLLQILAEIIAVLKTDGYIDAAGDFNEAKFNDIPSDLKLAGDIEAILKKYGVAIPAKIDQLFQVVPLVAGLFR